MTGATPAETASRFAAAMARLGPFEPRPALAVAVSGGRDSMALALLAAQWVASRGGALTALIVDHALRAESAGEARQVVAWLDHIGIPAHILRWHGGKPATHLQEAARDARYRLLCGWCRDNGVLHLATAHHRDDQAETLIMRQQRAGPSQPQSGIAAARSEQGVRLLRPLLTVPRHCLEAVLAAAGQSWVDDPSNRNARFERVRIRQSLARDDDGATALLADEARKEGLAREKRDRALAELAASCLSLHPAGYIRLDRDAWRMAEPELAQALLRLALRTVGGRRYQPPIGKTAALAALLHRDAGDASRTLAGCRVIARSRSILIVREPGRLPPALSIQRAGTHIWDRFELSLDGEAPCGKLTVAALGPAGWRQHGGAAAFAMPREAGIVLPALYNDRGEAHPARIIGDNSASSAACALTARFFPPEPLITAGLRVV